MKQALRTIVEKDTYATTKTPLKCCWLLGQLNDGILHACV